MDDQRASGGLTAEAAGLIAEAFDGAMVEHVDRALRGIDLRRRRSSVVILHDARVEFRASACTDGGFGWDARNDTDVVAAGRRWRLLLRPA